MARLVDRALGNQCIEERSIAGLRKEWQCSSDKAAQARATQGKRGLTSVHRRGSSAQRKAGQNGAVQDNSGKCKPKQGGAKHGRAEQSKGAKDRAAQINEAQGRPNEEGAR